MNSFIESHAYRCYNAAVKRGQDVSETGCACAVFRSIKALRRAHINDNRLNAFFFSAHADRMSDKEFVAAYSELFLDTVTDRAAYVMIALAMSRHAIADDDLFTSLLHAAYEELPDDAVVETSAFYLKMRYNEVKQD